MIAAGAVVLLLAAIVTWAAWPEGLPVRTEDRLVTVLSGPRGDQPVTLDTTLYLPKAGSPVPAVLVAHGFGGSKDDVADQARRLAAHGYVVLAYSARGFGRSGGTISLDSPDYEVTDARTLIDLLAGRSEVQRDGAGDPRVGVVGGSYGGALALLVAAYDHRVDAIVPSITWNDLAGSLFPDSVGNDPARGVFKRQWAGLFFGAGSATGASLGASTGVPTGGPSTGGPSIGGPSTGGPSTSPADVQCGRFSQDICQAYLASAATGRPTPAALALLRRSSPASVLDRITAPALLIQGQHDTLFPLSEADANARGIAAAGTPVKVAWYAGGHDDPGSKAEQDRVEALTAGWLDHYLRRTGPDPGDGFSYAVDGGLSLQNSRPITVTYRAHSYSGIGSDLTGIPLTSATQLVANPPGGSPAGISAVPGLGALGALTGQVVVDVPGQTAYAVSQPLAAPRTVVGAPRIRLRVGAPTGEAVLFVKLYDVGTDGRSQLPGGVIAPVRLTGLPATAAAATPVEVTLPAIALRVEAGHRLQVAVASADQAYASPAQPMVYQVAIDGPLQVPAVDAHPVGRGTSLWWWVLAVLGAGVGLGVTAASVIARRRRVHPPDEPELAPVPLVVRGLRKAYGDGYLAVADVSFRVEPGQVLGLLGPNGAGKTTTLRMLLGLIRPTAGELLVYGQRVVAGAPVLARLGALVEGTGFLPHLSGLANLRMYWRATGRPDAEARLDEALAIAGLGEAVHRKVRAYSHGMRQRLAIAQAMLGLPDLLVLDEPTNGLDPPQIHQMREVLRDYAVDGRAVLVSSHLLAEVEQTCSHVVVMDRGRVVADGPVAAIVGGSADGTGAGPAGEPHRNLEDVFLSLVGERS
jgi:ABC-2 type transport system ATP-binding protein